MKHISSDLEGSDNGTDLSPLHTKEIKILIVDDSSFDSKNIERQCKRTNMQVAIDTAPDLSTMRRALDEKSYDIIFVDYHLASETGLQARQVISQHSRNSDAATIMITGEVSHEVAVSAIKNGCKDYVAKSDLDALSLETIMKSATKRLENHASRVLQGQMDAIHDRTVTAMTEVVQNHLADERIVALVMRALQRITYVDGHPTLQGEPDTVSILEAQKPEFFDFQQLSNGFGDGEI